MEFIRSQIYCSAKTLPFSAELQVADPKRFLARPIFFLSNPRKIIPLPCTFYPADSCGEKTLCGDGRLARPPLTLIFLTTNHVATAALAVPRLADRAQSPHGHAAGPGLRRR